MDSLDEEEERLPVDSGAPYLSASNRKAPVPQSDTPVPPAATPVPQAAGDGAENPPGAPRRPVVFLDYTGQLLPWLQARARDPATHCILRDGDAHGADEPPPAAVVLVGVDPRDLPGFDGASVVEIRPR